MNTVRPLTERVACDAVAPPDRKSDGARTSDDRDGNGALISASPDAPAATMEEMRTTPPTTEAQRPDMRRPRF